LFLLENLFPGAYSGNANGRLTSVRATTPGTQVLWHTDDVDYHGITPKVKSKKISAEKLSKEESRSASNTIAISSRPFSAFG